MCPFHYWKWYQKCIQKKNRNYVLNVHNNITKNLIMIQKKKK